MPVLSYKPTSPTTVPQQTPVKRTRKRKPKKSEIPAKGISVPRVGANKDTGIHVVQSLKGTRYKLWYHRDGKKRYVSLPLGVTLEQARGRRDALHESLIGKYGAKVSTHRAPRSQGRKVIRITPDLYIYRRPKYEVRILGKLIGTADRKWDCEIIRNKWFRENADKLPPGTVIEGLPLEP